MHAQVRIQVMPFYLPQKPVWPYWPYLFAAGPVLTPVLVHKLQNYKHALKEKNKLLGDRYKL